MLNLLTKFIEKRAFSKKKRKLVSESNPNNNHGFTMIELLIVVVTMSLMFGLGFANYRDFQGRQILRGAAEKIKGDLRLAQELALAGKKSASCNTLNSYTLEYLTITTYQLVENCNNGNNTIESFSLDSFNGVQFNNPFNDVIFRVLGRGVVINSNIELIRDTELIEVIIDKGGDIK